MVGWSETEQVSFWTSGQTGAQPQDSNKTQAHSGGIKK
jgi:hypothetical protein